MMDEMVMLSTMARPMSGAAAAEGTVVVLKKSVDF